MLLRCAKCLYKWYFKGSVWDSFHSTCPNCGASSKDSDFVPDSRLDSVVTERK